MVALVGVLYVLFSYSCASRSYSQTKIAKIVIILTFKLFSSVSPDDSYLQWQHNICGRFDSQEPKNFVSTIFNMSCAEEIKTFDHYLHSQICFL